MYKSFDLLEKISFVRTGGSADELRCANIILEECKKFNEECQLEEFEVDGYTVKSASLKFINPDFELECCGVGMSSSTPIEGVVGDFIYINSLEEANICDVENKIVLLHTKLVNTKLYKKLYEKKAKALILCCGNVYDENDKVDLDPYMYRERHYSIGKIPAVCIRMKDAEKVLRIMPKQAHVCLNQDEYKNVSHNVVASIKGTKYPDEIVCMTAHYDSVSYSKGAYDNATGSTGIMQILSYFSKNRPLRTMKFIWCGSEENGLLGSKAYIASHEDEKDKYRLCINIDMIGVTLGYDIAVTTGETEVSSYIKYLGYELGFPISSKQGVYSSDSTPFADNGIPGISFARVAPSGGAVIHCRKDVLDYLSEENYYKTCDFIIEFTRRLVNSVCFPIEKVIPDNMKEEIDYYYGRKERK